MSALSSRNCISIIGHAGSGKDHLAETIAGLGVKLNELKFSRALKDMTARLFGWDSYMLDVLAYKEENAGIMVSGMPLTRRDVLIRFGMFMRGLDEDVWANLAIREWETALGEFNSERAKDFVCTDCRFVNEQRVLDETFENVMTVRIDCPDSQAETGASGDSENVNALAYDMRFNIKWGDGEMFRKAARMIKDHAFDGGLR